MLTGRRHLEIGSIVVLSVFAACAAAAQSAPTITAEPVPGQLEVMQGTAVKLGGAPPSEGPRPDSYHWEIVQGEGGTLYNEDHYEVIFQSPKITDEIELFVIRLTVGYPGEEPAHATAHIRVHRDMPEVKQEKQEKKKPIEDVMADFYRKEKTAREANKQRVKESQPWVVSQHTYSGFYGGFRYGGPGWGWGYGWGWPAYYPIYAPVVVPPPVVPPEPPPVVTTSCSGISVFARAGRNSHAVSVISQSEAATPLSPGARIVSKSLFSPSPRA